MEFFGFFDDGLKTRASLKQRRELYEFIGNFESWSDVPYDLRRKIVVFMDFETRLKLSFCSKNDNKLINSIAYEFNEIQLSNCSDNEASKFVQVTIRPANGSVFTSRFIDFGEHVKILWNYAHNKREKEHRSTIINSRNYIESAIEFVEKWMGKCKYLVKSMIIENVDYPIESSRIEKLEKCRNLRICSDNEETIRWWITRMDCNIDNGRLTINSNIVLTDRIFDLPHIKLFADLTFFATCILTDNRFLSLTAKSLWISADSISDTGINHHVKNWIKGNCVERFVQIKIFFSERSPNPKVLLSDVDTTEWDDEFETENRGFVFDFRRVLGSGTCYQIENKKIEGLSATFMISSNYICFIVTGNRMIYQNRLITSYHIPS